MKSRAASLVVCLALLFLYTSASAQHRFDVTIEGPWILHELKQFDGTNSMLLVMAPSVPGHYTPVITTGDGGPITAPGIYCVPLVGGTCKPNGKPFPHSTGGTGSYDQINLLPVKAYGNLPWNTIQSRATSFLLPMPDAVSNDGIDPNITLRSDFASAANTTPIAIGVHLHYNDGPSSFNLLACDTTPPPNANCNTPALSTPLSNSGTLRITMKAEEHTAAQDRCDYHTRMAYHSMLLFLDPTPLQQHPTGSNQNLNQSIAYLEHSDTPTTISKCRVCDPQLDTIPSSCAYETSYGHGQMIDFEDFSADSTSHKPTPFLFPYLPPDLGVQLSSLDKLLSALSGQLQTPMNANSPEHEGEAPRKNTPAKHNAGANVGHESCAEPDAKPPNLTGKFPTLSELTCVAGYLESKVADLASRECRSAKSTGNGTVSLPCEDARNNALVQIRGMLSGVQMTLKSGTSGKDCRAAVMLVQP